MSPSFAAPAIPRASTIIALSFSTRRVCARKAGAASTDSYAYVDGRRYEVARQKLQVHSQLLIHGNFKGQPDEPA